jgi:hypothetical protein
MGYVLLADAVMLVHFAFVLFVVFGSLLVLRWPWVVWLQAPALIWGLIVETAGLGCPLTPLENRLRLLGGESGYTEGFISHWLLMVLYPDFLTRSLQIVLGTSLLALNGCLYGWILARHRNRRGTRAGRRPSTDES